MIFMFKFKKISFFVVFALVLQQPLSGAEYSSEIETIEQFLTRQAPGLDISYREFFDALIEEGIEVQINGGAIRDLLSDPEIEPRDVDFVFSASREKMVEIVAKHHWKYTALPKGQYRVIIGDKSAQFLEGVNDKTTDAAYPEKLDFTVNGIFYDLVKKKFNPDMDERIQDLKNKRIRVLSADWDKWLLDGHDNINYVKVFRFWKMVGKGFIYRTDFEQYLQSVVVDAMEKDQDAFLGKLVYYISGHYPAYDEIARGCIAVMGYEWYAENMLSRKESMYREYLKFESELDKYTYN